MSLSLSEIQKIETKLDAGLTKIRNKKVRASLIQAIYIDLILLIPANDDFNFIQLKIIKIQLPCNPHYIYNYCMS